MFVAKKKNDLGGMLSFYLVSLSFLVGQVITLIIRRRPQSTLEC